MLKRRPIDHWRLDQFRKLGPPRAEPSPLDLKAAPAAFQDRKELPRTTELMPAPLGRPVLGPKEN